METKKASVLKCLNTNKTVKIPLMHVNEKNY